jgi:hypothetical protein
VRRLCLAILVIALGSVFVVDATNVTTNALDMTTFNTEVTIDTPPLPCTPADQVYPLVLRNEPSPNGNVGRLDAAPAQPDPLDPPDGQGISYSGESLELERDWPQYLIFRTRPAQDCGTHVGGPVRLWIRTGLAFSATLGTDAPELRARLFDCPADKNDPNVSTCRPIADEAGILIEVGPDKLQTADFSVIDSQIPAGHEIWLKIVARSHGIALPRPFVGWGYRSATMTDNARIEVVTP